MDFSIDFRERQGSWGGGAPGSASWRAGDGVSELLALIVRGGDPGGSLLLMVAEGFEGYRRRLGGGLSDCICLRGGPVRGLFSFLS
jgi:hypothetical protein